MPPERTRFTCEAPRPGPAAGRIRGVTVQKEHGCLDDVNKFKNGSWRSLKKLWVA